MPMRLPTVSARANVPLPYQGYNDRELQRIYGSLVGEIMANGIHGLLCGARRVKRENQDRLCQRFFLRSHGLEAPAARWLERLDRRRFEIFGYHTGIARDARNRDGGGTLRPICAGTACRGAWREKILDDRPHVLIYPEIGMDPMALQLAAQRLAPIQCSSWGHPEPAGCRPSTISSAATLWSLPTASSTTPSN